MVAGDGHDDRADVPNGRDAQHRVLALRRLGSPPRYMREHPCLSSFELELSRRQVDTEEAIFSYMDGDMVVFMNSETFDETRMATEDVENFDM